MDYSRDERFSVLMKRSDGTFRFYRFWNKNHFLTAQEGNYLSGEFVDRIISVEEALAMSDFIHFTPDVTDHLFMGSVGREYFEGGEDFLRRSLEPYEISVEEALESALRRDVP